MKKKYIIQCISLVILYIFDNAQHKNQNFLMLFVHSDSIRGFRVKLTTYLNIKFLPHRKHSLFPLRRPIRESVQENSGCASLEVSTTLALKVLFSCDLTLVSE
jgi:hypothetical protein